MSESNTDTSLNQALSHEVTKSSPFRMPRTPANFTLLLGYHVGGEDLDYAMVRPIVEQADIVLLESVGWTAEELSVVRGIARNGLVTTDRMNPYSAKTGEVIANTTASYHFWDPTVDDATRTEWRSYYTGKDPRTRWVEVVSLDEYREKLEFKCERTIIRDQLALKQLGKKIDSLVPAKSKRAVKVVVIAGIMHQVLGQRILQSQDANHRVMLEQPTADDSPTVYIRKKLAGETVSDDELARMLLIDIFVQKLAGESESTEAVLEVAYEELAKINPEEIMMLVNNWFDQVTVSRANAELNNRKLRERSRSALAQLGFGNFPF